MSEQEAFTIMVGVDGSPGSSNAAGFAARLASKLGARVVAVHAVGLLDVWPEHPEAHEERNDHRHVTELADGTWTQPIRDAGIEPVIVLRDGPPSHVLLDVADEYEANLLVVGTRGAGQAELLTLGGTATRLTTHSSRPTVVVPEPGDGKHLTARGAPA